MYILISFNEIGNKINLNVYVLLFHVMLFSIELISNKLQQQHQCKWIIFCSFQMHNYFTNIMEFQNAAIPNNMWIVWGKRFQNYNVDF